MRPFLSRMLFFYLVLIEIQVVASAQTSARRRHLRIPGRRVQTERSPAERLNPCRKESTNRCCQLAEAEDSGTQEISRACWQQQFRVQAAGKRITESRSAYFPQAFGNLTAVEANGDSAVAAGATTSSISSRTAGGASLVQMITDFGHTSNRVQSARFEAKAADQDQESIRQITLMQVQEAYFAAQAAESVRRTAQAVLDFRRVTLRQLSALAQSQLRSTLDVQFAQVMVSEAELAQVRAETNIQKAQAQLAGGHGRGNRGQLHAHR